MLLMCCQRPPGAVFSAWRFRRHCWYVRVSTVVRHNLSSLPSWKNCVYIFLQHNGAAPPGLYVHVTVHRDMWPCIVTNFFLIKPTRSTNFPNFILSKISTCFGHFLCPSSGVFYCTFDIGIFLAGLMTASNQGRDGTGSSNLQEIYQCRMYSRKLLMMGTGNARNM